MVITAGHLHNPGPATSGPFRAGRVRLGIQLGTLGWAAAGKAPLFLDGALIGQVSVGFPVANALPSLILYLPGMLTAGVLAALALARRLKRQTFGPELGEISAPA